MSGWKNTICIKAMCCECAPSFQEVVSGRVAQGWVLAKCRGADWGEDAGYVCGGQIANGLEGWARKY